MHTKLEWDPAKAERNLLKHNVDFTTAAIALDDDRAITIDDPDGGEQRFVSVGMDEQGRVLVVVYTLRGENIRIISARRATRRERLQYEGPR